MRFKRVNDQLVVCPFSVFDGALIRLFCALPTHPDYAALVDPLFAARKEGKGIFKKLNVFFELKYADPFDHRFWPGNYAYKVKAPGKLAA
jgi:hypothetical protein